MLRYRIAIIAAILAAAFVIGQETHHGLFRSHPSPLIGHGR